MRDEARLLDILLAVRKALRFVDGVSWEQFVGDELVQAGVAYMLQTVGEAAARLSPETRASLPDVPWRRIVGMRNVIVHDYANVNLARVWDVVQNHLSALIIAIEPRVPPP